MIYYKKKSLFKRIAGNIFKKREITKPRFFSFKILFCFLSIFVLFLYGTYLFLLPKYLNESNLEKIINNFILKNTKLTLDIADFNIKPSYKFDISLNAKYLKLFYPNRHDFITIEKPNVNIGLLSLIQGYIDFNKIKAQNIIINTNFTKTNKYDCFNYFDFNSKINSKLKIRNINLNVDKLSLNIFDENINKNFLIKSNNLKISSFEFKKPLVVSTYGTVSGVNHKILDFNLNLSIKINPNTISKFKDKITKLNYNPIFYADLYKFYSKTDINLKINLQDEKNNILGFISLKDYYFTLNNYKLPKNSLLLEFKNNKIYTKSDFKFIKNQEIKIDALMAFNKNKFIEAKLNSNEINLFDLKEMLNIAQKIFNFKLNLNNFVFSGIAKINLYLKSNFKTIVSNGILEINNAKIIDKKTGLIVKNINSNINFDNNEINILNSSACINEAKFNILGKIDSKTNLNLKINSDTINIAQILNLIKSLTISKTILPTLNDYDFKNGYIKINSEILGTFEKPIIKSKSILNNLEVYLKKYKLNLEIPKFESKLNENDVIIPKTLAKINSIPIYFEGIIKNYKTKQIEAELKLDSELKNAPILINNKTAKISANLNIKEDKLNIISGNIANTIQFFGEINNLSTEPNSNIKANISNKTNLKYENIDFATIGNITLLGKIKNPNVLAKLNLYDLNLPISDFKISDGFLNIKDSKLFFEFSNAILSEIILNSISFEGEIKDNSFNISNLCAQTLNGEIKGQAKLNLLNQNLNTNLDLNELNIRLLPNKLKELSLATSGKLSAKATNELNLNQKNVLDNLNSDINFSIKNGELSQFAKLERFLQAGNILSQNFLKLNLNSTISAITKQNTGDFKEIKGDIKINNGMVDIKNITTQGSNMSLFLEGDFNLITQYLNLKVLGRIPNSIVNSMGNLAKTQEATSLEKKLTISISENEINKIPPLAYDDFSKTREFIVLIDGLAKSLYSIKDFKWIVKE